MLQRLLCFLFGPFLSAQTASLPQFMKLLDENYAYVRERNFRILSTELPDDLLKKWLMPKLGGADAQEYVRNFADKRFALSEKQLPIFLFDYVLQNRFGRDIANFDEAEMEAAAQDLRHYILLMNYISRMRNERLAPIEFDIFNVENYAATIERIGGGKCRTDGPKKAGGYLWTRRKQQLTPISAT